MLIAGVGGILLLFLGFPLWLVFLAVSVVALFVSPSAISPEMVSSRLFSGLNVNALLAVPGFIFAAEVMTLSLIHI